MLPFVDTRFVFDEDSFELKNADFGASSEVLLESGENFVVGGANRWRYDTFVNWDFFPNVNTPILVYFKENQTPQVNIVLFIFGCLYSVRAKTIIVYCC